MASTDKTPQIERIPDWKKDAISDAGFASIFFRSLGVVGSKFDIFAFSTLLLMGISGCIGAYYFTELIAPASKSAPMIQQWASLGTGVSSSILGFLISGFSVFATITKPELFRTLAQFRKTGRSISEFKFVFYNFLYIFAHYIAYLSICLLTTMGYVKHSPLWYIYLRLHNAGFAVDLLAAISGVILSSYTIYAVLLLRSFLWNLYQTLLFAIFYEEPKPNSK